MTSITFTLDSAALTAALDRLRGQIESMRPVMDDIGNAMVENIRLGISEGREPWGNPMEPIKPRRRQGARRVSDKPLNDTRQHIYNRITHQPGETSVAIGMNESVDIGATHQFGATIQHNAQSRLQGFKVNARTGRSRFAKRGKANFEQWTSRGAYEITIPARPFLPIRGNRVDLPPEWSAEVMAIVQRAIQATLPK